MRLGSVWGRRRSFVPVETDLHNILNSPQIERFTEFAKKEYAYENISFWTAVSELHQMDSTQIECTAKYLFKIYINTMSPKQVNISSTTRDQLLAMVKEGQFTKDMFDGAQREIFEVMKVDLLPRYLSVPQTDKKHRR